MFRIVFLSFFTAHFGNYVRLVITKLKIMENYSTVCNIIIKTDIRLLLYKKKKAKRDSLLFHNFQIWLGEGRTFQYRFFFMILKITIDSLPKIWKLWIRIVPCEILVLKQISSYYFQKFKTNSNDALLYRSFQIWLGGRT